MRPRCNSYRCYVSPRHHEPRRDRLSSTNSTDSKANGADTRARRHPAPPWLEFVLLVLLELFAVFGLDCCAGFGACFRLSRVGLCWLCPRFSWPSRAIFRAAAPESKGFHSPDLSFHDICPSPSLSRDIAISAILKAWRTRLATCWTTVLAVDGPEVIWAASCESRGLMGISGSHGPAGLDCDRGCVPDRLDPAAGTVPSTGLWKG